MSNISPEVWEQISQNLNRPEGTIEMVTRFEDLLNPNALERIIFQIATGSQVYRVERTNELKMVYYYSSPGTGTRVAEIDLKKLPSAERYYWGFTWSPARTSFFIGPRMEGGELLISEGVETSKHFRVGRDGSVIQVGDEGIEVLNASFFANGKPVLQPTAIDAWKGTDQGIKILQGGTSDEGYLFEVVLSNLTLSSLVTGFEAYCKTRFMELPLEGIKPNIESLVNRVFSQNEREAGEPEILEQEAESEKISLLEKIAKTRINFQNYDECKRAFNKAYGIKFGEIGLDSNELLFMQRIIKYRHKIVHVSPLVGMLNQEKVPPEEPEFSNKQLANKALNCFSKFVDRLHEATLKLKRID